VEFRHAHSEGQELKGEYRHEWRHSNVPGNDYQADVVLVGARLQR
jgi:hypothetical protein